MARNNPVSIAIYRKHTRLYRYLNDTWIFTELMRPDLKRKYAKLKASKSKAKKPYRVPKKTGWVESKRRDEDIGEIFQAQHDRGVFEANLVNIVSRVEAFIQECMTIAILAYPQKLSVLSEGGGIPVAMLLEHEDRETLLRRYVESRCEALLFAKPSEYLSKAAKVLSVEIADDIVKKYIEIKASRDIVVHGTGTINKIYIEKAGDAARGQISDVLVVDRSYLRHVVITSKLLSGQIQAGTEKKYR